MHTLQKIRLFRVLLCITYPLALLFVYPIALLKKKSKGRFFFFFDRYIIGGGQKVHLDILASVSDVYKTVYFTRSSSNDKFRKNFWSVPNSDVKDIHFWCENLFIRLFSVHFYAFYLNRHRQAHVFSSNSTFFYDLLFFLRKDIIKSELLHSFSNEKNGMEFFGLGNHKYLNHRLVVDKASERNMIEQHKKYHISDVADKKIMLIEPGVVIPEHIRPKDPSTLKVLYAGRSGDPKRIYLLSDIAEHFIRKGAPVEFHFAGNPETELSEYVKAHSHIHGQFSDPAKLYNIYMMCDVVIMTSWYEGFPMLIKEGMACGCIPVVTALEGIKSHLTTMQNSILIEEPMKERVVVKHGIAAIDRLIVHPQLRETLANNARIYAVKHFSLEHFTSSYRKFFETYFS
jgi:L-malate glycosyltransferase